MEYFFFPTINFVKPRQLNPKKASSIKRLAPLNECNHTSIPAPRQSREADNSTSGKIECNTASARLIYG